MPGNESRALFSLLDIWASFFVSKGGEAGVPSFVVEDFCKHVRAFHPSADVQEVIASLEAASAEEEMLEFTNDSNTNRILYKFFATRVSMLPEEGRVILANCRKYLNYGA